MRRVRRSYLDVARRTVVGRGVPRDAVLRLATVRLANRPARHRLLLVLSDGKPDDVEWYAGCDGAESAR